MTLKLLSQSTSNSVTTCTPAERPLLVVVEAPPALDVDAAEVRRAVGTELRCQAVAPLKTAGDPPERALIVALDRERITLSLRTGDAMATSFFGSLRSA